MQLTRRIQHPKPPELGSGDARGLSRQGADGDEPGIGAWYCVYATGHPGHCAAGQRGAKLEIRDSSGSEMLGAGDAVVGQKRFIDVHHAAIVPRLGQPRTAHLPAMCTTACTVRGDAGEHVRRSGVDMCAAPGGWRTYGVYARERG